MEGIKTYRLGDISTMKYGKLPPNSMPDGQYPVYSGYRYVGFTNTFNCTKGTLIVVARGVGGTGDVKIAREDCFLTNLSISVTLDARICNPLYLYYKFLIRNLKYLDSGSAQSQITIDDLKRLEVTIPSLREQNRVVEILQSLDDKIALNKRIIHNLEEQARALFKNWFVDFEPYKDSVFVESEVGTIPQGLVYKRIEDMPHTLETGKRPSGGVKGIDSGVPSIGAENIKGLGSYDFSKTKFVSEEYAAAMKKGKINGFELLIYKDGGKPGYFIPNFAIFGEGYPYDEMYINEHVFKLDFNNKGYSLFAYFFFKTKPIMSYLNVQGSKAAIPGINSKDINAIMMPSIENECVKNYCNEVEDTITHILVLSKESARLATLRDTLLPRLMSGELS